MESKKSFFSKALYVKHLKRFAPWSLLYCIFLLFAYTGYSILYFNSYRENMGINANYTPAKVQGWVLCHLADIASFTCFLIVPIVAIVFAMMVYSYLHTEAAAYTLHALPIKREAHLLSGFAAALTLMVAPVALPCLIGSLYFYTAGYSLVGALFLHILLIQSLSSLIFLSLATFTALLVGNSAAAPVLYAIINGITLWIYFLCNLLATLYLYGVNSISIPAVLRWLCPAYNLYMNCMDYSYNDSALSTYTLNAHYGYILPYCVGALVLLAVSVIIYKKRDIEIVGEVLALPKLSFAINALVATISGVAVGAFAHEFYGTDTVSLLVFFYIGSLLGFVFMSMLLRRRFKLYKDSVIGFCVYFVATLLIILSCMLDVFGIANYVPEAEDISYIYFDYTYITSDSETIAEVLQLHEDILAAHNSGDTLHESDDACTLLCLYLDYTLSNGKTVSRAYYVDVYESDLTDSNSILSRYYRLINDPDTIVSSIFCEDFEASEAYYGYFYGYLSGSGSTYTEIPAEDAVLIAEATLADIAEGNYLCWTPYFSKDIITDITVYTEAGETIIYSDEDGLTYQLLYDEERDEDYYLIKGDVYYLSEAEISLTEASLYYDADNATYYVQDFELSFNTSEDSLYDNYHSAYFSLNSNMLNTIAVLEKLGYISEEAPLIAWGEE